ncbi:MAG: TIM barrel protein [Rubellimicrobium sp.]|nr:TIM barrel protein [Rubellimicrobium sp.]
MRFALNHIIAPQMPLGEFFAMARDLGCSEVEIRNDLRGAPVDDGTPPATVRHAAESAGVVILAINALYPFNQWSADLSDRAARLADYAADCGAKALVMCPLNEGISVGHSRVVAALESLAPILRERGLLGMVEPLGFARSSMRTKSEAIAAIEEAGAWDVYRLVHDTFHHHLGGEAECYPRRTGLVHVSGVSDPSVAVADLLDAHRGLVDADDRLNNIAQIRRLIAGGYAGPFSYEPFAAEVQALADPRAALRASMDHVRAAVAAPEPGA